MTFQIGLLLLLIGVAMVFFWWERLPAEVVALGLLLALVFTGLLPVDLAFQGASNDAVIMIFGLLVLTAALQRTGVIELAGRTVLRHAGEDPNRLLLIIMIASAVMGAFMSNTASTAFFVPVVMGVARKAGISPSRLLMPLAFSSILTSSVTLVSTSTNLVVSGMIRTYRMEPMGMFELTPVGIPIAVAGLIYMFFLGRRLIPERASAGEMTDRFGLRPYLTEIVILPESPLANKTLAEARVSQELGLTVLGFIRDKTRHLTPTPDLVLRAGDVLIAEGNQQDIVQIKDVAGVEIKADVKLSDPDLQTKDMALAEAILLPGSPLINRTLKEYRFRERTGAQVLGLNHQGRNVTEKISRRRLRMGDVLLVQGRPQSLNRMHEGGLLQLLHPLEAMEERRPKLEHAPWAIGIFVVVLAMAALDFVPLTLAVMLGVLLVFLTGCITPEQAYKQVEWKALLLIGAMLGAGQAMEHTGAAKFLAGEIVSLLHNGHSAWLLTGFFVLTVLLTQPMSNQAAAIVVLPVALQAAFQSGLNPRTFAMMVAVAASCSYLTPLEPSCLMVYAPGRYRFRDFLKVGLPLTVLIYVIAILLVPKIWPLK